MKTILKIFGVLLLIIILVGAGAFLYITNKLPNVKPAEDITIEVTPERLERGAYLVNNVVGCTDCHSLRDFNFWGGPIIKETEGAGGDKFDQSMGFPGVMTSQNITPAGLGDWTDGELIRAMRTGVSKDGSPLFPIMPYMSFRELTKEDLFSIVVFIRTLKPVEGTQDKHKLDFPMNLIVHTIPNDPPPIPEEKNMSELERGRYLTTISSCRDCHTPQEKGQYIAGREYAGGMEFNMPDGSLLTVANITPHPETGIGKWTKEDFIAKFKTYDNPAAKQIPVKPGEFNTYMPWFIYAGMTEEDLGAIYTYLKTVPPVDHKVERFKGPTASK